jgi:hypothetical protein
VTRTRAGGIQLNAGGYAFGLRVGQSCLFDHIVAHTGGLPGYGSIMQWLPEHGVGIVALGNLTYTGWSGVVSQAFDLMAATGGLQPRMPEPSPALAAAREAVSRLVNAWSDPLADSIAAMNLYLDEAKDRRRRDIEGIRARSGNCQNEGTFLVENALRGEWSMRCERGGLRVAITLAPTIPPRVQYLRVERLETFEEPRRPASCPSDS